MRSRAWLLLAFTTLLTVLRRHERFSEGQMSGSRAVRSPRCPECGRALTNHGPGTYVCVTCRFRTRPLGS